MNSKIKIIFSTVFLSSCVSAQLDRMEWLGKEPPMQPVQPKQSAPIIWPAEKKDLSITGVESPYSLYNKKSKGYFKDIRARTVGDILTVNIRIDDKAQLDNNVQRKRQDSDVVGASALYGLEKVLTRNLPGDPVASELLNRTGNMNNIGQGSIDRKEVIATQIAAVVTEVLPNGNLVVYGSQEIRVNYEIRQLTLQGVIRPEDISPKNDIQYNQIAEARVSYGGKGIIMDIQQPRIGNQLADIISPF
jgi:flagellar L-ring protein precursor FlgH